MQENEKKKYPFIETLICAAITALAIWAGKYIYVTLVFLPFTGIYTYTKNGLTWITLLAVTGIAAAYLIAPELIVAAAALLLIPAFCTGTVIRKKLRSYRAVVISAAGWLAALGVIIAYIYITKKSDPLTLIMRAFEAALGEDDALVGAVYAMVNTQTVVNSMILDPEVINNIFNVTVAQMREFVLSEDVLPSLSNTVCLVIPTLAVDAVVAGGFVSYVAARAELKRCGEETAPMPGFDMLKIPAKESIYFVVMYLLSYLPTLFGIESLYLAANVLAGMLNVIFFIQGMSLIVWLLRKKIRNKGLSAFIAVLISTALMSVIPWLGFIEQVFRVRDRAIIQRKQ